MRKALLCIYCIFLSLLFVFKASGQEHHAADSLKKADSALTAKDTTHKKPADSTLVKKKKQRKPSQATIRSAIIPGLGQAYNKKYWKIPLVYGALAIPVYTFFYNKHWYEESRYAYTVKYTEDTANYKNIDPRLAPLSLESLRFYRNDFRRNMDYSVLAFLLLWGLQVVDATVDAHLKGFNVNDDLSINFKAGLSPMANTNGISIVLNIGSGTKYKSFPGH
jgi:hypothetical protein